MKYIASFSGGKDSAATIILAHLQNEPLDEIIFSKVMFDENTSGDYFFDGMNTEEAHREIKKNFDDFQQR